jgi:hypothetical protein
MCDARHMTREQQDNNSNMLYRYPLIHPSSQLVLIIVIMLMLVLVTTYSISLLVVSLVV